MKNFLLGLLLSFNAMIGILLYHFSDANTIHITTSLAVISSVVSFYITKKNFVYFFRVLVISWVGLVPAVAISMGAYFALRMPYVQTLQIGWIFGILVCTTLFSSLVGFSLADKIKYSVGSTFLSLPNSPKFLFWLIFCLLIIAGYLLAAQEGDFVFQSAYGIGKTGRVEMPVQNLQSVTAVLLGILFITTVKIKPYSGRSNCQSSFFDKFHLLLYIGILYIVVWAQFLRGARMDPVGFLILIFVLYYSTRREVASLTPKYLILALTLIGILQIWGAARSTLVDGVSLYDVVKNLAERDPREIQGVAVLFFQGTFNNISVGVAGAIHAIEHGLYAPLYGQSYIDFISRIPPASLYPGRPESLAWFSEWVYNDSSGGGMNEMGEVYLNFGIYGSLLVPGIISFLIGWAYNRHLLNPLNIWASLPFIGIFGVYTRGILYQTYDSFKSLITAYILYFGIFIFSKFIYYATKSTPKRV